MNILETEIHLEKMYFYAYHGAIEQENKVGGDFTVDLFLTLKNIDKAISQDQLSETVHYGEIYDCVKKVMLKPSNLLENVAGRIASKLFLEFEKIVKIKIIITKNVPPMSYDGKGVSFSLLAER